MTRARLVAALTALTAITTSSSALAQVATNGVRILVHDQTLLPGESTTIRMEAYFGGTDWALAGIATWLLSSTGAVGLSDPVLLFPVGGAGTSPGFIHETGVRGIIAGQLQAIGAGIFADPTNPMPFWEVTYTAPIDASAAFDVVLESRTSRFNVYISRDQARSESRIGDFAEGTAVIRVIPAPATALALAALFVCPRRRKAGARA